MATIKAYVTAIGKSVVFDLGGGKHRTIDFKTNRTFSTREKSVQDAIENSSFFKTGDIKCTASCKVEEGKAAVKPEDKKPKVNSDGITELPEVTTINDAVAILKSDPYNVDATTLKTPEDILSKAADCKILFPNLVVE